MTWTNLYPGDMYNFSVVATSQTDEYTDIKTQMTSVNDSTLPADPVIVQNLARENDCNISSLDYGNAYNLSWHIVYGTNSNVSLNRFKKPTEKNPVFQIGKNHEKMP